MIDMDRIARMSAAVIKGLREKGLTPVEMQEVIHAAVPLAQIEIARMRAEAEMRLLEIQQKTWQPSKDVKYEPQHQHND